MNKMRVDADVCVVGAGIVGLAHALEAQRRGLTVVVLDRHDRAVGASVRNFGHVFVGAVADVDLPAALRSRERWLELGPVLSRAGTVVVARAPDELAVLEAAAAHAPRGGRMITPEQAAKLAPIDTAAMTGALHSTHDLRVDPRTAVAALAARLGDAIRWRHHVDAIEPGEVRSGACTVRAPVTIVCPGPSFGALQPEVRPSHLSLCRLQMLRVAAPAGRRYDPALATGLSLIRYPAFASRPEAEPLRRRLTAERPELLEAGIHLLVTQLPDGDLIIGDTHEYGDPPAPFGDERLDELLLAEARKLLGVERLNVRQRWHGIYATGGEPGEHFHVTAPHPGVRVVEVVSGLGMTMSLGLASETLDEVSSPRATAPRRFAAAPPGSAA